jgi:hypothetical protein
MKDNGTYMPQVTRRSFFRVGMAAVSGFYLEPVLRPFNMLSSEKIKVRGTADYCIFIFLNGGASQLDTFDLKEGRWTPPDFDVRTIKPGIVMPYGLFPNLAQGVDKLAIVRSIEAWESAHARAQYYLQVGHSFSAARRKEMPAIGAVVASEFQSRRKDTDFLPPFVAMNFNNSNAGLIREGCLPNQYGPLSLDMQQGTEFVIAEDEKPTFDRRLRLLEDLNSSSRPTVAADTKQIREFATFTQSAVGMMLSPKIASALALPEADRKRYGTSAFGDACILARNMVQLDAGTRFVLISHNGWDLHSNMYDPKAKVNHYTLCRELDTGLAALLSDLSHLRFSDGKTLLEKTFVVSIGEFGRTGGDLSVNKGRDHNRFASTGLFAGAGVRGGRIIGATDQKGEKVIESGWEEKRSIYTEDVLATIYSQMGIDWGKRITNTPSGRDFEYLEPASGTQFVGFREISPLFA